MNPVSTVSSETPEKLIPGFDPAASPQDNAKILVNYQQRCLDFIQAKAAQNGLDIGDEMAGLTMVARQFDLWFSQGSLEFAAPVDNATAAA